MCWKHFPSTECQKCAVDIEGFPPHPIDQTVQVPSINQKLNMPKKANASYFLTVFGFLPNNSFKVDTCPRLTGSQAFGLRRKSNVAGIDRNGARADHDLLHRRCNTTVDRRQEMEGWRGWGGGRRVHLWGGRTKVKHALNTRNQCFLRPLIPFCLEH